MSPHLHYLAKHINGEMSAGTRNRILREFKMSARGIITNARCLGEGGNVPVVYGSVTSAGGSEKVASSKIENTHW